MEAVVPLVDPSAEGDISYLPLLFFLPLFFPGRSRRKVSNNPTSQTSNQTDSTPQGKSIDSINGNAKNSYSPLDTENFDNYGISYRKGNSRTLYIIGIGILAVAVLIIIYFTILT